MANAFRPAAPYALAVKDYGGVLLVEQGVVTVGVAVVEVAGGDPERVTMTLINLGTTDIFVSPEVIVSTTRGIRLGANGGGVTMDAKEDGILQTLQWFGISSVAGQTVFRLTQRRTIAVEEGV